MRLVHTADVHLDACFPGIGSFRRAAAGFGNRRRQNLRDVFHAIVRRAGEWPADALLIAGDLYEGERVTHDTLAFLCAEFESIPQVPVFIAPGNHDPFMRNSPYAAEQWPPNVNIFSSPRWTSHDLRNAPATIHGFGFDGPDISSNPFGDLRIAMDGRVHVAVAHGSERQHQPPGKEVYAPFDAPQAASEGLAYLALGHFHSVTSVEGDFQTRMYYCGAPEGHSFGETGPRHYLEVEIDPERLMAAGARTAVHVTPVVSSRAIYMTHAIDCSTFDTAQQAIESIRSLPREAGFDQIARVTLEGASSLDTQTQLPAIFDAVAGDFEFLDLVDNTEPAEDYSELADDTTSLGAFVSKMNDEIASATDQGRRRLLERAREVGLAAFHGRDIAIRGWEATGS